MYPDHETACFALQYKSPGVWRRDLLAIKNKFFALERFETAADIFLEGISIAGRLATFAGAHGREYSGAEPLPQC